MPEMSAEDMAKWQEYQKLEQPSAAHKLLQHYVGTWDTVSRIYTGGPGSQAIEARGVSTFKSVLGGKWVMEEHQGTMMGMPHNGIGMMGYDNYKQLYVTSWYSNRGTEVLHMKGARHPKTGVVTMYGPMDEPLLGVHARTVKYVVKPKDDDHYTFEIYDLHAGDDYRVIEVEYTRRKK
jgi:hypothetical protein